MLWQVDDLDAFVKEKAAAEPEGTPFFIGGQSMGGLIAVHEVREMNKPGNLEHLRHAGHLSC